MNFRSIFLTVIFTLILGWTFGQTPKNWFLLDNQKDGYPGVSADRAYDELLRNKKPDTVIVAIIDSGVDFRHDGLKNNMWVNPNEISDNGIDDDGNGYIDDIHGWNFIGGPDGRNVKDDTYELTRLYAKYHKKYGNANPATLSGDAKKEYAKYLEYKEKLESERGKAQGQVDFMTNAMGRITGALVHLGMEFEDEKPFTKANVMAIEPGENQELAAGKGMALSAFSQGLEYESFDAFRKDIIGQFSEGMRYYKSKVNSHYNPEFDPRHLVGDNYADSYERFYGNNDYKGPDAQHGTHVAGIVGMHTHDNDDIYGVARHVKIMTIRAVPDGDERDKDVANAIRYAVDNGASVINMSFGKGYSWDKQVVDDAVRYAEKHDVLLVHAAGNSSQDIDVEPNFPNARFEKAGLFKPKKAKNWLEVGALAPAKNEIQVASFSNYGKKNVDIFAPGAQIYATVPNNKYEYLQGTSMASPMVAGVAAVIRSYFPELTARQVRDIIMASATPVNQKVKKPGTNEMVDFKALCVSGGFINTYEAVKIANNTKGKKKPAPKSAGVSAGKQAKATVAPDENPRS